MAAILRVKDENGNIVSIPAIKGDKGEKGDKGDRGLPGSGGVPDGGTTGQVLTKNSNADGDAGWKDSSGTAFSDDGSGNISVNGASANAKRFLNSLTVPGLDYKYVNPINSGTYASPYGVYISSGTVIDYVVGLTQVGFYTAYVNRRVTDIPDAAKAANSSLRGFVCVSQIDNTASGGSTKCYAYIVLIDQNSNFYIQYIQGSVGGGWKRMYPYETAESTLMEKLDKNQGTANSGKFLGIGADGVVVPTEVGGGGGSSDISFPLLYEATTTEEVRWIDTGANAFRAKRRLIIQLISKATSSNSADNTGCGSIYTDGSPISSAFANYVLTNGMTAMLPKQYDRLNTFYGYRANDDASWIFYHTNRTVVNAGSTALNCANQNSAVSKKDITGFIIGDNSAAVNEGTRVFGIGTEIKVWGV